MFELNYHPAIRFYEEYFGEYTQRFQQDTLGRVALLYPLGMSVPGSPEYLLRAPFLLEANGAIQFRAEIPEGSEVCLMIGSADRAISAARIAAMEALAQMQGRVPKLALIFNCIARRKVLGRRVEDEIDTIRDIIGRQVPAIGFYTYGEAAPVEGIKTEPSFFHNETVVILLLG